MKQILFIEPDKKVLKETGTFLQNKGYTVIGTGEGTSGIEKALKVLPDIILCNSDLPEMHGYEVFKALQQNKSTATTPFVLLMNNASVQNIREAMNLGIDDCLAKPYRFDDLEKVIETRLKKKQKTIGIASKIIEQQKQYLDVLPKTTQDGFWVINHKGQIVDVNDTYCKMSGFSREEILQMKISDMVALENEDDTKARMQRIKENGSELFETRHWRKDKTVFDVEISVTYLDIKKGQYICFCRDITEHKKAENALKESEAKYRRITENISDVIWTIDLNFKTTFVSPSIINLTGDKPDVHLKRKFEERYPPKSLQKIRSIYEEELNKEKGPNVDKNRSRIVELQQYRANGTLLWVSINISFIRDENGNPIGLQGVTRDITKRKQAEQELKQSNQRNEAILEALPDLIFVLSRDGVYLDYYASKTDDLLMPPEHFLNRKDRDVLPGYLAETNQKTLNKVFKTGEAQNYSYTLEMNGKTMYFDARMVKLDEKRALSIVRNITEQKVAELALKESEERFQLSMEATNDGLWDWNVETDKAYFSPGYYTMLGYKPGSFEARGKSWSDLLHPEDKEDTIKEVQRCIDGEINNYEIEFRFKAKDGTWKWILGRAKSVQRNHSGKAIRIVGTHVDITDRKKGEEALRQSEAKFKTIINQAPEALFLHKIDGSIVDYNQITLEKYGYSTHEILQLKTSDIDPHYKEREDQGLFWKELNQKKQLHFEAKHKKKDGTIFPVEVSVAPIILKGESYYLALATDITERKQAEKALQEKNDLLERVFDSNLDLIALADLEGNYTLAGKSHEILGYEIEYLIGKNVMDFVHPDDAAFVSKEFAHFLKTGKDQKIVYRNKRIDGTYLWFETIGTILKDEKGNPEQILFNTRNITEQKKAEEELIHSHNLMQYIIEHNRSAIAVHDKNLHYIYVSKPYFDQFKVKEKDIIGKHHYEVFPDLPQKWRDVHQKALQGIVSSADDDPYYKDDGTVEWTRWECRPWYESDGSIGGIIIYTEVITERKKAEDALRSNYDLLQIAGETAHFGGWSVDLENNIVTWSDAVADIHEVPHDYSPPVEEALKFYAPEWREKITQVFNDCAQKGIPYDEEIEIITSKGKRLWVRTNARAVKDESGKIIKVQGSFQDITERKQAEKALKESEERFKALHNASFGGITIHDKGVILECNQGLSDMTGYSIDELIGMDGLLLIAPESRDLVRQKIAAGYEKPYEAIGIRKNGNKYALRLEARNIPYKGKKVRTVEFRDITESKQAEEALRKSEAIKNKMVSNIGDVIVIIDKDGINQYKSPNIEKLFGWKPEELIGKNTFDIVHPEDVSRVEKFISELALKSNASGTTELRYKRKDGKYVWIEITVVNLLHDKDIKGIMGNYQDISERKNAEQELIAAKEHAEESDRLKSAFLANMSHEIRTPMNSILGFSTLLGKGNLPEERKNHFLNIIQTSGKNLVKIVDDVIDIAIIDSGQLKISKSEVSLNQLFNELNEIFRQKIKSEGYDLKLVLKIPQKEYNIFTDELRVKQILSNFLSNALKFTEKGEIEFGFRRVKNNKIRMYVKDTGIGIPPDKLETIFERFRQADDSTTRRYGGTGLGLAISKNLVELLDSKIGVKTEENIGSEFYFTLPDAEN